MHKYCVEFENRGQRTVIKLQHQDAGVVDVTRNRIINLSQGFDMSVDVQRFVHLLRFRRATSSEKPIRTKNMFNDRTSQCTRYSCFDHLASSFSTDWCEFNNVCNTKAPGRSHTIAHVGTATDTSSSTQANEQALIPIFIEMLHMLEHNDNSGVEAQRQHFSGQHVGKDCLLDVMHQFSERLQMFSESTTSTPTK